MLKPVLMLLRIFVKNAVVLDKASVHRTCFVPPFFVGHARA